MAWVTAAEAAKKLGIKTSALRTRAQQGKIDRKDNLYFVDEETPKKNETVLEDVEHDDANGYGSGYEYDKARDKYIFALKSKAQAGRPYVVDGDTIRAAIAAYSNDGSKASLNEICRTHGWSRPTAREIFRALGKTHDSLPFSDEEIAERGEDDLGEDLIRLKEERVARKAEAREWNETKKLAEKARNFDHFVADRITSILSVEGLAPIKPPTKLLLPRMRDKLHVFATPSDLHYGKGGWRDETGEEYDRKICRKRLLDTADAMIARVSRFGGAPAEWILGAGSDWFHIDRDDHGPTTTRGTPQDTDGTFARVFLEGSELACEYVTRLRSVAPVRIVGMRGNHDSIGSLMLLQWLAERFKGDVGVAVDRSPAPRRYLEIGQTLVGITHGDGAKDHKLPGLMAAEEREAWGRTRHRVWFTGHMHTAITYEWNGVRVVHCPSLAGTDRWHAQQGYKGNRKALAAYLLCPREGMIGELNTEAR